MALVGFLIILSLSSVSASASSHQYVSFSLTHKDAESSPLRSVEADPADLPSDMPMRSFVAAGRALRGRVNMKKKLGKPLMSKLSYGGDTAYGGDFFLTIPVGTPSQKRNFFVDTGSEFTWTPCSPCLDCPNTTAPRFAHNQSSSFLPIRCDSDLCLSSVGITRPTTACATGTTSAPRCLFELTYGDKSVDRGFFAIDSFDLGSAVLSKPFVFGCADNVHDNSNTPGLLGLDAGPFSFISQLFAGNPGMPKKFAYCLPDRIKSLQNMPGRIEFGNYKRPENVRYTPLAPPYGPLGSLYYYVKLEGISVGETLIKVDDKEAKGVKLGGGTVFDSGSALTSLVKPVYNKMVREIKRQTAGLFDVDVMGSGGTSYLCHNAPLNAKKPPKVPRIRMHFAGGAELELGPGSILFAVISGDGSSSSSSVLFCLAIESTGGNLNIIGNYQQQNYWVEYNLETSSLGLAKAKCALY